MLISVNLEFNVLVYILERGRKLKASAFSLYRYNLMVDSGKCRAAFGLPPSTTNTGKAQQVLI